MLSESMNTKSQLLVNIWTYGHFYAYDGPTIFVHLCIKNIYSLVIWGITNSLVQLAITNIEILIWYSSRQHKYLKNKKEKKNRKR